MNFRIEQYRIFNTVAKTNSFSKAAESLYMTQSAVSQAIKQLETSIDTILFIRTAKGVELTQAGNILYKYTSSAMELLETGLIRVESLKTLDEGELKIVDVNIRRLRIKIEDDTANPTYITTVWGFGYKWGA